MIKKKKDRKDKSKKVEEPSAPTSAHTFTRNYEIQTLSLKEALTTQITSTKIKREEMRELNNRFDIEVHKCKEAEQELARLQQKLAILQSKVKGLELQYENEQQLASGVGDPSRRGLSSRPNDSPSKQLPMMSTIRKIHQFPAGGYAGVNNEENSSERGSKPHNSPVSRPVTSLPPPIQRKLKPPPPRGPPPVRTVSQIAPMKTIPKSTSLISTIDQSKRNLPPMRPPPHSPGVGVNSTTAPNNNPANAATNNGNNGPAGNLPPRPPRPARSVSQTVHQISKTDR